MKPLTIINPYNDDSLEYNNETGRYQLTIEYCKNEFDDTYKNDQMLKRRIKLVSRAVYYYINTKVASWNKPVVHFFLNRTEEGRKFLLELLDAQQYADIQSGYGDIAYLPAVNFNGQDKDRGEIERNTLCVAAEQVFNDSDSYFGVRLDYHGQFPPQFFMLARSYQ